ncbi:hypothetical protein BS78_09G188000 [Paspalum vaginatum]|nr:hypothetical protein BS78_09G188000 [Paspalum vaginatum]
MSLTPTLGTSSTRPQAPANPSPRRWRPGHVSGTPALARPRAGAALARWTRVPHPGARRRVRGRGGGRAPRPIITGGKASLEPSSIGLLPAGWPTPAGTTRVAPAPGSRNICGVRVAPRLAGGHVTRRRSGRGFRGAPRAGPSKREAVRRRTRRGLKRTESSFSDFRWFLRLSIFLSSSFFSEVYRSVGTWQQEFY